MSSHEPQFAHDFTDTEFRVEDVRLDGNRFTRCTFTHCRLIFDGEAVPVFTECHVAQGCEFVLAGHARTTAEFFSLLVHRSGHGGLESFHAFLHDLYGGAFEPDAADRVG